MTKEKATQAIAIMARINIIEATIASYESLLNDPNISKVKYLIFRTNNNQSIIDKSLSPISISELIPIKSPNIFTFITQMHSEYTLDLELANTELDNLLCQ